MGKALMAELQRVSQLNSDLLQLSCTAKWDEFMLALDAYAALISEAVQPERGALSEEEQNAARELITTVLGSQALMVQRIRVRLDQLRTEMAVLNKGKAVSKAYAAPFTATLR